MSGTKFLLDTNIVLYLLSGDLTIANLIHNKEIYLSFITEIELLSFRDITDVELSSVKEFLGSCKVVDINEHIKERTVGIRKYHGLKLPDSIIAATSEYLGIPLLTADKAFKRVENVNSIFYEA